MKYICVLFSALIMVFFVSPFQAIAASSWTLAGTPAQQYLTTGTTNNITYSNSGDILIVAQHQDVSGTDIITGITYNSVALTRINTVAFDGSSEREYLYYLLNPAQGSNTLTVTTSSNMSGDTIIASWTGAKQSGQPDAQNTNTGASVTTLSVAVTSVVTSTMLVGMYCDNAGRVTTPGANTQLIKSGRAVGSTFQCAIYASSPYDVGGTGSHSLVGNETGGIVNNAWVAASFAPAPANSFNPYNFWDF